MAPSLMEVLQGHHSESWGWALACCDWRQPTAEDVLQEAYLRVLDGRARFQGRSAEKTWFFAVIRRVAQEHRRRNSIPVLRHLFGNPEAPEDDPLFEDTREAQSVGQLKSVLRKMSQRQREVLHLVFYQELTLEETARTLGISVGSARTHYHRAKAHLAQELE